MIFNFSGTGNTRWVAEQIAAATSERLVSVPEAVLAGEFVYELTENERVGFCFPVHGWFPPKLVRTFVSQLKFTGAVPGFCFAATTCGDDIAYMMHIFRKDLAAIGITLHSAYSFKMPESYVAMPFMNTDTVEREKEKINITASELEQACKEIVARRKGIERTTMGAAAWLKTWVIGTWFNRYRITDKKFHVCEDKCTGCGRCVKACPMHNMELVDGKPRWNGNCTSCLACFHHCLAHAILYGHWTKDKGQYYFGRNNRD